MEHHHPHPATEVQPPLSSTHRSSSLTVGVGTIARRRRCVPLISQYRREAETKAAAAAEPSDAAKWRALAAERDRAKEKEATAGPDAATWCVP